MRVPCVIARREQRLRCFLPRRAIEFPRCTREDAVTTAEGNSEVSEPGDDRPGLDRRKAMRAGAATAVGLAGALIASAVTASPAAAGVDGDVTLGADNVGTGTRTAITDG